MIKLIVSDLDGTLVEDGGGVLNPEYFSVIRGLKAKGIYFCAASGRHASGIEHLFLPVKDEIFYIGGNGTYVGCRGRELYRTEYKTELTRAMIHDMREAGMEIIVDSSDCVYTDSQDQRFLAWIQNGYHFRVRQVEDLLELAAPVMKIAGCRMDGIAEAARPVMEKYGGKLKVTLSGSQWLDTMERSVNKGAAVKILQDGLMIRPEETVVFGDQMNDVEMLKQAYYSFAVVNARPETKQAARFLADSNENLGPLKIMRLFL